MKTLPEAKQLIVNELIDHIIADINKDDSTVLNELLMMLHPQTLVASLPEEEWVKYFKIADIGKTKVEQFIKEYGTRVRANEDDAYVELMMDDHFCIQWGKKQYYIPDNVPSIDDNDNILEILKDGYIL